MSGDSSGFETPWGKALRNARDEQGRSVRSVAQEAGVSDTLLHTYERGFERRGGVMFPANPTRGKLIAVARALRLDVVEILRLAGLPVELGDDAAPEEDEAYLGLEHYLAALRRAHGDDRARAALNRLYRVLNDPPNASPGRDAG